MNMQTCMICLETRMCTTYCYEDGVCQRGFRCAECRDCLNEHPDAAFPIYESKRLPHESQFSYRCSLDCLIRTTINNLDSYLQCDIENDFIKKQQKLLESIYATTTLNHFLYKDLINIINEYIYTT